MSAVKNIVSEVRVSSLVQPVKENHTGSAHKTTPGDRLLDHWIWPRLMGKVVLFSWVWWIKISRWSNWLLYLVSHWRNSRPISILEDWLSNGIFWTSICIGSWRVLTSHQLVLIFQHGAALYKYRNHNSIRFSCLEFTLANSNCICKRLEENRKQTNLKV